MNSLPRLLLAVLAVGCLVGCDELDDNNHHRHHHRHDDDNGNGYYNPPPPPQNRDDGDDGPRRRHRDDGDYSTDDSRGDGDRPRVYRDNGGGY